MALDVQERPKTCCSTAPIIRGPLQRPSGDNCPRKKELRESQTLFPGAADESGYSRDAFQTNIPTELFKKSFKWELGVNGFFSSELYAIAKLINI